MLKWNTMVVLPSLFGTLKFKTLHTILIVLHNHHSVYFQVFKPSSGEMLYTSAAKLQCR